jgi:hypothetical protein
VPDDPTEEARPIGASRILGRASDDS